MIGIEIAVPIALLAGIVGATVGVSVASLCAAVRSRQERVRWHLLLSGLGNVVIQARYALARYPDAVANTRIVELALTRRECEAIVGAVEAGND